MIAHWWNWVAPLSAQLAVLGAVAYALDLALQRWLWPQHRAWIWALCMIKLVLPPDLRSPVSVARVAPAGPSLELPATLAQLAFALWLAGLVLLAAYGLRRHRADMRARTRRLQFELPAGLRHDVAWCAESLGLARAPRVALSHHPHGPAVLGIFRPMVVLPVDWCAGLSRQQRRHVLLHEFGHVARRDPLWSALGLGLQLLYWFHPVVWLAQRRLALLREEACDALVYGREAEDARAYRSTLLQVAARVHDLRPVGLGFVSPSSQLVARLRGLERWDPRHRLPRRLTALALLILLAACVAPLGTARLQELPGCLPLRFQVLKALAEQESLANPVSDEGNQP